MKNSLTAVNTRHSGSFITGSDDVKILLLLTGGTIGSAVQGNTVAVSDNSSYDLIRRYEKAFGHDAQFVVKNPISTLSENMSLDHWNALCRELDSVNTDNFDGIIIAHGSDTLSYTSALLGLLYSHLQIPVVLIAANYPLADRRSNGIANLRGAVELISEGKYRGVYTVYRNNAGRVVVYLATRLLEADTYCGEFSSFGGVPLGEMRDGKLVMNKNAINPSEADLQSPAPKLLKNAPEFKRDILMIKPYPGLKYSSFSLTENIGAVLQLTYHSSTVCVKGVENSALTLLEQCKNKNIPFYLASFRSLDNALYETSHAAITDGAIPLKCLSPEAAYAKLLTAYNQNEIPPDEYLRQNIFYEQLPE